MARGWLFGEPVGESKSDFEIVCLISDRLGLWQAYTECKSVEEMIRLGLVVSGFLVEVAKVTISQMEEWRQRYPAAFERKYHSASGIRFNAWVENEN